jgi:hypothetical protein
MLGAAGRAASGLVKQTLASGTVSKALPAVANRKFTPSFLLNF